MEDIMRNFKLLVFALFLSSASFANYDQEIKNNELFCEKSDLDACYSLSMKLMEIKQFDEANKIISKICKEGNSPYCYLGIGDLNSHREVSSALKLSTALCKKNDFRGCAALGVTLVTKIHLLVGTGVYTVDQVNKIFDEYIVVGNKACRLGHEASCEMLKNHKKNMLKG